MAQGLASLEQQFTNFSKFGDTRSDGKTITLTQSDKWLQQAKVIDGKLITITDTGVAFNKFKKSKITYSEFVRYLDDLAKTKGETYDSLKHKLMACGMPGAGAAVKPDEDAPAKT